MAITHNYVIPRKKLKHRAVAENVYRHPIQSAGSHHKIQPEIAENQNATQQNQVI